LGASRTNLWESASSGAGYIEGNLLSSTLGGTAGIFSVGGARLLEADQKREYQALGAEAAEQAVLTAPSLDPDFSKSFAYTGEHIELGSPPSIPLSIAKMFEYRINLAANLAVLFPIPVVNQVRTGHVNIASVGPDGHRG